MTIDEPTRQRQQQRMEAEFDKMYHRPDFPRDDFDNGVARGLGLMLAVYLGTDLDTEIRRSLDRLAVLESHGEAPYQLTAKAT